MSLFPVYWALTMGFIVVLLYVLSTISQSCKYYIRMALLSTCYILASVSTLFGSAFTYFQNSSFFAAPLCRDLNAILETMSSSDAKPNAIKIAMTSLRDLTLTESDRKAFYALSFPGFHPRAWKKFLAVFSFHIDNVRRQLANATVRSKTVQQQRNLSKLFNLNASAGGGATAASQMAKLFDDKQCFFLPPSLNPRSYEYFGQSKRTAISLLSVLNLPPPVLNALAWLSATLFKPKPLLSDLDTHCAVCCIQAITAVVIHSTDEDRYGIVQKDLRMVISTLAGLSSEIDIYVRTSKMGPSGDRSDANVFVLDETLAASLRKIYTTFEPYVKDLQLPEKEVEILQTLTH